MIVNRYRDGWQLITQPAHAWLSGELAAAWVSDSFDQPSPYSSVTMAARLHDIGWAKWDSAPRLGDDGNPVNFFDTTLSETAPIWRRAVSLVSVIDPYAGLLVSMHASTIYRRRKEREAEPTELQAELESLSAEQKTVQEKLAGSLKNHPIYGTEISEEKSARAYRWLRACDLLSLVLCSSVMQPAGVIKAYQRHESADLIDIQYHRPNPFEVRLEPFPFSNSRLELTISHRTVPNNSFRNQAEFQTVLEKTPWSSQAVIVSQMK